MTITSQPVQDLIGGLVPDIRPGMLVPGGDPGADGCDEFLDRTVGASPDPLGGELAEPALDQVHRRSCRWE